MRKLNDNELKFFDELGQAQLELLDGDMSKLDNFFFFEERENGIAIIIPCMDESDWDGVNPIDYYKDEFLNSDYMKLLDKKIIVSDIEEDRVVFEGTPKDFIEVNEFGEEVIALVKQALQKEGEEVEQTFGASGSFKIRVVE